MRQSLRTDTRWLLILLAVSTLCTCGPRLARPHATSLDTSELLPPRLRRLTNVELERSVHALLLPDGLSEEWQFDTTISSALSLASRLPPDVRQSGYSPNVDATFPPTTATRWRALVGDLITQLAERNLLPQPRCASADCINLYISVLTERAYRRPATRQERSALLRLFQQGSGGAEPIGGAQLVTAALLQSPSFLYVTELGRKTSASTVQLTQFELAATLSFTISGSPPDEELLRLAQRGELASPATRIAQARRLLGKSATRFHFRRFVLEWLEADLLMDTAKDSEQFPNYERLKEHMLKETSAYADEVFVNHGASVRSLLYGRFVSVDPAMARYYGLETFGPVVPSRQVGRVGVLQHASFLSAHAHPDGTSPVRRGDFVLRKVLCRELPRPGELGIEVVMPPPTEKESTRARFSRHAAEPACQTCHQTIDPLGFTLETFDAAGKARTEENGDVVNSSVRLGLDGATLEFADSVALAQYLSDDSRVRSCFARQAFRYFSAQSDPRVENAFLKIVEGLPPPYNESLIEMLVAYVGSDLFAQRRLAPRQGPPS